jgi:putative inorganic carbon (HCO3(-)) transporter
MSAGAHELAVLQGNRTGELLPFRWPLAKRRSSPTLQEWAGAFFILVNAVLFVRPAEIIPGLEDWPIYGVLMTCALIIALPLILQQLTYASLSRRPITVCVLGLFICTITSHLSKGATWEARASGTAVFKLVLYYLLLTATVTNVARLRRFLLLLVVLGVIVTTLALLQYYGLINIPALEEIEESFTDPQTGERVGFMRLVSTGIFHDPMTCASCWC